MELLHVTKWEYYRDLVFELVKKELKLRYKNSILGFVWSLLLPVSYALIYYVAFKIVFKIRMENYFLFLLAGLFPWQWLSSSLTSGTMSLLSSAPLIKKTPCPRELIVLSSILAESTHFIMAQMVFWIVIVLSGIYPNVFWLLLPVLYLFQMLFILGLSYITATLAVFFKDTLWFVNIVLNIWFYATPILYSADMIPDKYKSLIHANPMAPFVLLYQGIYLDGSFYMMQLIFAVTYGLVVLGAGLWFFNRLKWYFAEAL